MPDLNTTVNGALEDMLTMLKQEAATGAKDSLKLLEDATRLTTGVMKLTGKDQLEGLESIGYGCISGLAAIANERKRAIFQNILTNSLKFVTDIAKSGLGMLGKGV